MASASDKGVSGGTPKTNKARAGDLGRGSPVKSRLQSPSRASSPSGVATGLQERTATAIKNKCIGCDSNLQKKRKMSLLGADKVELLAFVQEARPGFLAKRSRPDPLK
jgi:hypothetical protein